MDKQMFPLREEETCVELNPIGDKCLHEPTTNMAKLFLETSRFPRFINFDISVVHLVKEKILPMSIQCACKLILWSLHKEVHILALLNVVEVAKKKMAYNLECSKSVISKKLLEDRPMRPFFNSILS